MRLAIYIFICYPEASWATCIELGCTWTSTSPSWELSLECSLTHSECCEYEDSITRIICCLGLETDVCSSDELISVVWLIECEANHSKISWSISECNFNFMENALPSTTCTINANPQSIRLVNFVGKRLRLIEQPNWCTSSAYPMDIGELYKITWIWGSAFEVDIPGFGTGLVHYSRFELQNIQ